MNFKDELNIQADLLTMQDAAINQLRYGSSYEIGKMFLVFVGNIGRELDEKDIGKKIGQGLLRVHPAEGY